MSKQVICERCGKVLDADFDVLPHPKYYCDKHLVALEVTQLGKVKTNFSFEEEYDSIQEIPAEVSDCNEECNGLQSELAETKLMVKQLIKIGNVLEFLADHAATSNKWYALIAEWEQRDQNQFAQGA